MLFSYCHHQTKKELVPSLERSIRTGSFPRLGAVIFFRAGLLFRQRVRAGAVPGSLPAQNADDG